MIYLIWCCHYGTRRHRDIRHDDNSQHTSKRMVFIGGNEMSDLKHQTVEQLETLKEETKSYIDKLKTQLAGQNQRLEWINRYIFEKTAQEMTIEQIERKLGHRIIIK